MISRANNEIRHSRAVYETANLRNRDFSRQGNHRPNPIIHDSHLRRDIARKDVSQHARKEITAGVIVFRRTSEGLKFLLLYHRGQYWNFPKGHVEKEERSLDAAIRETTEETGLKRGELRVISGFKEYERFYFKKGKETIFKVVIIYLAETREPRIKISHEHQGYAWFLYREARQIVGRYKENQKVLEKAHRFISERQK